MRLLRRLYDTNMRRWIRRREVLRARSETERLGSDLPMSLPGERAIFVLLRCGTELLTNLFDATSGVACNHNEAPELIHSSVLAWRKGQEDFDAYVEAVRAGRFELMAEAKCGRR